MGGRWLGLGVLFLLFCVFSYFSPLLPVLLLSPLRPFFPPPARGVEPWPPPWRWLQAGRGRGGQLAQQLLLGDKRRLFAVTVAAASQNSKSARLGTTPASLRVAEGWYVGG